MDHRSPITIIIPSVVTITNQPVLKNDGFLTFVAARTDSMEYPEEAPAAWAAAGAAWW